MTKMVNANTPAANMNPFDQFLIAVEALIIVVILYMLIKFLTVLILRVVQDDNPIAKCCGCRPSEESNANSQDSTPRYHSGLTLSPIYFTPVLDSSFLTSGSVHITGTRQVYYDPPPKYEEVVLDPTRICLTSGSGTTPPPIYKNVVKEQIPCASSNSVEVETNLKSEQTTLN